MVKARKVADMRLRQTKLSPLFRCFAAAALFVWLAAQVLCTAHCNFGVCHSEAGQASCHGPAQSQSHHDEGDSPTPAHDESSATAACLTLKSALLGGGAPTLVQPEFFVLYTLPPIVLGLDATATEPVASISRDARPRDWVFTPEVSLGPALHSLAPPFAS